MLTIELKDGPRVTVEHVGTDAFGAAVLAATSCGNAQENSSLHPYTGLKRTISEPQSLAKQELRNDVAASPHGERSRRAREVALSVLADGEWHPKAELNAAWRATELSITGAAQALHGHVEKRSADGRAEWRLDPGSELWDDLPYNAAAVGPSAAAADAFNANGAAA